MSSPSATPVKPSKVAELALRPDGTVAALSSRGGDIWTVRLTPRLSCTCPGFTSHGHCYHSAQAQARYGALAASQRWQRQSDTLRPAPACEWCGSTVDVRTGRNGWDNNAELSVCAACLEVK